MFVLGEGLAPGGSEGKARGQREWDQPVLGVVGCLKWCVCVQGGGRRTGELS